MKTIKVVYAVYDKKAKVLDAFMMFNNDAEALRAFANTCEKNEVFQKWPEDFEFVKICDINELGKVDQKDQRTVAQAINYVPHNVEKKEQSEETEKK